jgi:hypothetical protein
MAITNNNHMANVTTLMILTDFVSSGLPIGTSFPSGLWFHVKPWSLVSADLDICRNPKPVHDFPCPMKGGAIVLIAFQPFDHTAPIHNLPWTIYFHIFKIHIPLPPFRQNRLICSGPFPGEDFRIVSTGSFHRGLSLPPSTPMQVSHSCSFTLSAQSMQYFVSSCMACVFSRHWACV